MNVTRTVKQFVLGAAMASLASVALFAQDSTTSGDIQAGGQTVTGDHSSSKFQQYEEVPSGLVLFGTAFAWDSKSGYTVDFKGENFGYDDQWATLEWAKKGQWKLNIDFSQNPRWFSNTATTLYAETQPGVFLLPTAVSVGIQSGADIRNYLNGSQPVGLKYERKTGKIAFQYTGVEHWLFKASYQNEQRSGTQSLSLGSYFSVGNNTVEIASPVDYRTNTFNGSRDTATASGSSPAVSTTASSRTASHRSSWTTRPATRTAPAPAPTSGAPPFRPTTRPTASTWPAASTFPAITGWSPTFHGER